MSSRPSGTESTLFFFFFQAEDGIRDKLVTGVQTCALPISGAREAAARIRADRAARDCRASSAEQRGGAVRPHRLVDQGMAAARTDHRAVDRAAGARECGAA